MKYKCLVLDHDDTLVNSTATIHYPCFIEYLKETKPEKAGDYTLYDYFVKNFHPGVEWLFLEDVGLSEEEFLAEQDYWSEYVKNHIPKVFGGIAEILSRFKAEGGIIAVASHSYTKYIERDYSENGLTPPDCIYSWDLPKEKRKPHPFTLLDIMERYNLSANELLVVDDLKPGYDMARAAGVDFCAAGWAYDVPEIEEFMRRNCDFYCKTTGELYNLLFEDN